MPPRVRWLPVLTFLCALFILLFRRRGVAWCGVCDALIVCSHPTHPAVHTALPAGHSLRMLKPNPTLGVCVCVQLPLRLLTAAPAVASGVAHVRLCPRVELQRADASLRGGTAQRTYLLSGAALGESFDCVPVALVVLWILPMLVVWGRPLTLWNRVRSWPAVLAVMDRLNSFLPALKAANVQLEEDLKRAADPSTLQIGCVLATSEDDAEDEGDEVDEEEDDGMVDGAPRPPVVAMVRHCSLQPFNYFQALVALAS
jgi:hypothetical protein